jgi:hypothetical protein
VAVAAVALAATAGPAAPGTAAPRARAGVLTGDTTVEWRGTAGIRLRTDGAGSLPRESMTLFVRGGTYAFVSMLSDPQPPPCAAARAHCYGFFLAKFPAAGSFIFDERPGHDHLTRSPDQPRLSGRYLDLYLMTDGVATLRLRPTGHRGRSSYVAAGRISGLARELPRACATVCGSTAVSEVAAGGAAFDFGNRPGQLITHVVSTAPRAGPVGGHPYTAHTCYYPQPFRPTASPDPRDHPHGCDLVPDGPEDEAGFVVADAFTSINVGGGAWASWYHADITGKRYIGFRAGQAWVEEGVNTGYGVWFHYGIR